MSPDTNTQPVVLDVQVTTLLAETVKSLTNNNFYPIQVATKEDALAKIKELIPEGASVMNGASITLEQVGYVDLLKNGNHTWNNLHTAVLAETDPAKQARMRRESVLSDFYLGSAHALTEAGEIVIASNSGSQLPHLAFTSPNIILVIGEQKLVPTLADAFKRIQEQVIPLEDVRMKSVYGFGTQWSKTLILHKELAAMGRKVYVIIVGETLGY